LGLLLAGLVSSGARAKAPGDIFHTPLGVSPDRRYAVEFAENAKHEWVYRWLENKPRHLLLEMKCTYQPDDDGQGHLFRDKLQFARDVAGVSWSGDGRILAIDEGVLRMSGTVLVAERLGPGRARQVIVPERKIRVATGEGWARARLWLESDGALIKGADLELRLVGWIYDKSKSHPETEPPLHHACVIVLHLGPLPGGSNEPTFTIESCKQLPPD
jgi:hypothetical protein